MPSKYQSLKGGLDLSSSPLEVNPGYLRDGLNFFESTEGGYERVGGYERFDGKFAPSDDEYWTLRFDSWDTHVTDIVASTTITVGSQTFYVLEVDAVSEPDTAVVQACHMTGTIPTDLDVSPVNWDGVSSLVSITLRDTDTDSEDEALMEAAWTYTRSLIGVVPGTSAYPAGILQIDDTVVAFKNDSTTPKVYYSSASGWVEGNIGRVAEITGYTADSVLPGETIDSGAFVVMGVCAWYDTSGLPDVTKAWFVLAPTTGTAAPATGANTASGGASFTIASVIQPINAFGEYIEYRNYNFLSNPEDLSSYLCDGTNLPMCWSPQYKTLLPISTNFNSLSGQMATEIIIHNERLMYATGTGTFASSEPGLPYNFSGEYGAAEIGVGGIITSMEGADSEHLIVYTGSSAKRLLGSDNTNWQFIPAAGNVGSQRHGTQKLDDIFSFNSRGVTALRRTDTEGGYAGGSVSHHIQKLIKTLNVGLQCSTSIPSKEQVRWYFDNGTFLVMTRMPSVDGFRYSFTQGYYPDRVVRGACTEVWSDGSERTFFVSDDGYVYEAEKGTTFDGASIYAFIDLQSNHLGSPGQDKGFKRVFFEAHSENYAILTLTYNVNYGEKVFDTKDLEVMGGVNVYNLDLYDSARYDTEDRTRSRAGLKGKGFTIGFTIDHDTKFSLPVRITGYTVEYSVLGKSRK